MMENIQRNIVTLYYWLFFLLCIFLFANQAKATNTSTRLRSISYCKKVILDKNNVEGRNILTQAMISEDRTLYVVCYDYDLNGADIVVPSNSIIEIKGGSLNFGSLVLSSNTRIKGHGCVCRLSHHGLSHKNFIRADGVDNIELDDICLEGSYDNSKHIDPWMKNGDAENPIFITNSSAIVFKKVGITKFASDNMGPKASTWDKDDKKDGFAAIKLYNCENVLFEDCYERESAGEAWEWTLCKNVTLTHLSMVRTYGVSSINVQACDNFVIKGSEFLNENCKGNIVNFTASNSRFSNNKVEVRFSDKQLLSNGLIDFGNEFVNRNKDYYSEFVVQHNRFENNILLNSGFCNASEWQGNIPVNIKNISFSNNKIIKDVSLGVPLTVVHLGHYQGVDDIIIKDNYIELINKPQSKAYKRYQFIIAWTGKSEWATYKGHEFHVNHLVITGNKIVDFAFSKDFDSFSDEFLKGPYGAVVIKNASDILIKNNSFQNVFCPIYFMSQSIGAYKLKGNTFMSYIDSVVQ